MAIANPIAFALHLMTQRTLLEEGMPALLLMTYCWTFGFPLIVIACIVLEGPAAFAFLAHGGLNAQAWGAVVYSATVAGVFAFATNSWAQQQSSLTLVSVYLTTSPIFTAVMAFMILGQGVTWLQVGGALTIIYGVLLVIFSKNREAADADEARLRARMMAAPLEEFSVDPDSDEELEGVAAGIGGTHNREAGMDMEMEEIELGGGGKEELRFIERDDAPDAPHESLLWSRPSTSHSLQAPDEEDKE